MSVSDNNNNDKNTKPHFNSVKDYFEYLNSKSAKRLSVIELLPLALGWLKDVDTYTDDSGAEKRVDKDTTIKTFAINKNEIPHDARICLILFRLIMSKFEECS
jgi:hypothetical protein